MKPMTPNTSMLLAEAAAVASVLPCGRGFENAFAVCTETTECNTDGKRNVSLWCRGVVIGFVREFVAEAFEAFKFLDGAAVHPSDWAW